MYLNFYGKLNIRNFPETNLYLQKNTLQFILGPEWHCGTELLELLQAL